jgi:sterol desaturase/sphingolipid hydroxylase (fatty acid hydroxylase superfamily)
MIDWFTHLFALVHGWLFEQAVQPLMYSIGAMTYIEESFTALQIFLFGLIEIALMLAIMRPLEKYFPVEKWSDRSGTRVDVIYTLLTRLGVLPLIFFFMLVPIESTVSGWLRLHDVIPKQLEDFFPTLIAMPLLSFCIYLIILDFSEYIRHRLQHRFNIWWALHSVHHSQRMMSFWTDDRNHVLDGLIRDLWIACTALLVGVPPGQFVLLLILMRMVESFSHANVLFTFGVVGEKILVSPHFHRIHHAINIEQSGKKHGCNFAVLFPVWDIIFRTANFSRGHFPTGIADQLQGRDYGQSFWQQQVLGFKHMFATLTRREPPHKIKIS